MYPRKWALSESASIAFTQGLIETPMVDWVLKHPDPNVLAGVVAQISLGRTGQPQRLGPWLRFLPPTRQST